MAPRTLPDLVAARGEAGKELSALLVARAELDSRLDALDLQQREASEERERASAALADLERAAASGQPVSAAQRTKAENAVTEAKIAHAAPWEERRQGLRAAARDADAALNAYVAGHFGELLDELQEDADASAEAVDRACRAVESAFAERQRVDAQVTALAAMVRNPRPGDVARTKAEAVVRAASGLLEAGGEVAPRLIVDPRAPRHGGEPAHELIPLEEPA